MRALSLIEAYAFSDTGMGGTLNLPNSVTTLEEHAFAGTKITAIGSLGGVTDLPDYVFSGCKLLTSVTIPAAIKTMGTRAFSGCVGLESVTIEEGGITAIPDGAFRFQSNTEGETSHLTSVTIPDTAITLSAVLRRSQDQKNLELWLTTDVTPKAHPNNASFVPTGTIRFTIDGATLAPPPTLWAAAPPCTRPLGTMWTITLGRRLPFRLICPPAWASTAPPATASPGW